MVLVGAVYANPNVHIPHGTVQVVKDITRDPIRLGIGDDLVAYMGVRIIVVNANPAIANFDRGSLASWKKK